MSEFIVDKIHPPTPHRRELARQDGHVAKSYDLVAAVVLFGGSLALLLLGGSVVEFFTGFTQQQLGGKTGMTADADVAVGCWYEVMWDLARVLLPVFGLVMVLAVAGHMGQNGFLFLPKRLAPDIDRISPLRGVQRMFSSRNLIRLAFGIIKIAVIVSVGILSLWGERERLLAVGSLDAAGIAACLAEITLWTCLKMATALVVLGLADYGYQRWRHEQDLRMTTAELREELKNQQSDPLVTNRRKSLHRQLTMRQLQDVVPQAKLVIAHGTLLAVAIDYDPDTMPAPRVLAKGSGETAAKIRDIAQQHDVRVVDKSSLARSLYEGTPVQHAIPPEHYEPVARLLRDAAAARE